MVSSKDFNQDYNTYYRPSLDDINFIPSQGVLPLYYYEHKQLRGTIEPQGFSNLYVEINEHDDYSQDSTIFSLFPILLFIILSIFFSHKFFKKLLSSTFDNSYV